MSDNYTDVLLEDMNSKFDTIMEVLAPLQKDMSEVKQNVAELKTDMKIVKAAVTDLSH